MNLKKIIREEIDSDWVNLLQSEPNIWFSYQMIYFDEVPTEEEVIKFIKDAFKSGLVKPEAIRSWELEDIRGEAETIYRYAQKGTQPYLRIDLNNEWLYYGEYYSEIKNGYPELRKINYSEAKKYQLKESTGFEWMDDISGDDIRLKVGDEIRIKNRGDEKSFLNWLGDYSFNYEIGRYGAYITGEIVEITDRGRFVLKEKNTGDRIYFPINKMDMEKINKGEDENIIRDYLGLDMEYQLLNFEY